MTTDFTFTAPIPYIVPQGNAVNFIFLPANAVAFAPTPGLIISLSGDWSIQRQNMTESVAAWSSTPVKQQSISKNWGDAQNKQVVCRNLWTETETRKVVLSANWKEPPAINTDPQIINWGETASLDKQNQTLSWDASISEKETGLFFNYLNTPPKKERIQDERWDSVDLYGQTWKKEDHIKPGLYLPKPAVLNFVFNNKDLYTPAYTPEVYFQFGYLYPNRPIQPKDTGLTANYKTGRQVNNIKIMPWGFGQSQYRRDPYYGIRYPDYNGPVIQPGEPDAPEDKASYQIVNTVSIVKLPERTPLEMAGISISRDIDAFAWTFSARVLNKASMTLIEPDGSGAKDIEVDINGFKWVFMIERYTSTSTFPADEYQVTGSSRTQYLGAPYAPVKSNSYSVAINAKQAATNKLASTGFTLNWDIKTPDWTIDAGVYQYQNKRPIEVIAEISAAVGAIIVPGLATDEINIQPRYKLSPWEWDAAPLTDIDHIATESMTLSLSVQWQPKPTLNAVYVSGINAGKAVNVVRSSTAGDAPAPDHYHALNLDDQQCREKGRNILAESGNQSIVSLELPLPPSGSPGLIQPGALLEYRDQAAVTQWRGLVLSNQISASGTGAASVTQQAQIERHY